MATDSDTLKWTAQFAVTPPTRTKKLPGDKILLPPSALEQLLAAAPLTSVASAHTHALTAQFDPFNPHTFAAERRARELLADRQQQLPHPLTFRIVNPSNGRVVHAGIREFSAQENEVGLSAFLRESLGLDDVDFPSVGKGVASGEQLPSDVDMLESGDENISNIPKGPLVTIHAKQLPKGSYVRLRPLEAGYDPEDWKALLERHLRENFTTLTAGELLLVPGERNETFRFLVDKLEPQGDGICIVDTDLEVDIEALNEEQARETLKRRLAKASRAPGTTDGSSIGGQLVQGQEVSGQVLPGDYVDYELNDWDRGHALDVEIDVADDADVDLFISPFSTRQRNRPRDDEHVFGDFSNSSPKRICLQPTNIELQDAEALYISVHAYSEDISNGNDDATSKTAIPLKFSLHAKGVSRGEPSLSAGEDEHDSDDIQCTNCHQWIPKRTLFLHENFCLRNNILCPKCENVFQKRSPEWEKHWHCPHDSSYGNDLSSQLKHNNIFHTPHNCPNCPFTATSLPALAHHRTTTCPSKPILCQFCHLIVPQQGEADPDMHDPEVLLSGLTPHELADGGRTTECHLCNKIIRLKDMKTHLRHHDLDRRSRPAPRVCRNRNCGRTLQGSNSSNTISNHNNDNDTLGLCTVCFGPLYADVYDPEGKALRRRIERRYLTQMLKGCGKSWCLNPYCKTGRTNDTAATTSSSDNGGGAAPALTSKEISALIKPLIDNISIGPAVTAATAMNTPPFYFCTDEKSQQRRKLAELLAAETGSEDESSLDLNAKTTNKGYDVAWCIAAVEAGVGDVGKAREWLKNWAPEKGERVAVG
ncbi:hypothetical protein AJ78_07302 [Emergomyces pasteurianus Ep9510]|uniref:Uncharacterized protein n=1 Tax=Emergomyces pasteurianus Ep9510 TaxID=1447872 RepID=A0A1J9P7G2_9EURO|nr:hypothetical protein AJ78_07302 [Emergomyces pasteurianus Ep9510]